MVVQVEQIREGGLTLEQPLTQPFLAQVLVDAEREGYRPEASTVLRATFLRSASGVLVQGSAELPLLAPCKRCVAEVHLAVPVRFTLNLVPAQGERKHATDAAPEEDSDADTSGSFDLAEADLDTYQGKTIDLDPILREQLLLALPMQVVCREDCRGLCGMCGQDLNEAACGCESKRIDPRLAILKDIKLN
jgi:uncharacterized protein